MTARELDEQLHADPVWVAAKAKREEARRLRSEELAADEATLIADLRGVGVHVKSVWRLTQTPGVSLEPCVPILLDHFGRPHLENTRDGIARALGRAGSAALWPTVVQLYRAEQQRYVKDGLALALADLVSRDRVDEVVSLLRERTLGPSRLLLLTVLSARISRPGIHDTLVELRDDPDLVLEITRILHAYELRQKKKRH